MIKVCSQEIDVNLRTSSQYVRRGFRFDKKNIVSEPRNYLDLIKTTCGGLLLVAGVNTLTLAQESEEADGNEKVNRLEEVVVTARRVEESLQRTPVSVVAFGQSDLQRMGISEAGDIARFTPNLVLRKNPSNESSYGVSIRGMANPDAVMTIDSTVGMYVDGVYISRQAAMAFDVVDLERIEVLRGPQGTLYGRNTIGGAINVITEKPRGEFALRQKVGIGNRDRQQIKTILDLPRIGDLAVRLSAFVDGRDGLVSSVYDGSDLGQEDSRSARIALHWTPLEDLSVNYSYDWGDTESQPNRMQMTHMRDIYADPNGAFYGGPYYETAKAHASSSRRGKLPIASTDDDDTTTKTTAHALTVEWDVVPELTIKSISSYRDFNLRSRNTDFSSFAAPADGSLCRSPNPGDYDFISGTCLSPVPVGELVPIFGSARVPQEHEQWTQEIQFIGSMFNNQISYTAGIYYFEEEGHEVNPQQLVLPAAFIAAGFSQALVPQNLGNAVVIKLPNFRYSTDNKSYAAYGDFTYQITSKLDATLGFRFTRDERETTLTNTIDGQLQTVNDSESWSNFDPKLTIQYQWLEDVQFYGQVSTGYRSGGFNVRTNTLSGFQKTFDEEEVLAYELGWKTELFDRRVRFNGAFYYMEYTDQQIPQFEAGTGGASSIIVNAGEATHSGVELDAVWLPFSGMKVAASYAYLDVDIEEFVGGRLDPVTTGGATNPGVNEDLSDIVSTDRFAPDQSGSLTVEYEFDPWSWGQLMLRGDVSYTDKIDFFPQLNEFSNSGSHTLVDGRITLSDLAGGPNGSWEVSLWGKNLTNEEYRVTGIDFGTVGFTINNFGELRSYGIEVVYSYNR